MNLTTANEIMAKIIVEDTRFTHLSYEDYELFDKFISKSNDVTYGNSWAYITQGMYGTGNFNLGYKFYDGNNLSAVCIYPKIEDPSKLVFYWVRPFGEEMPEIIHTIGDRFLSQYNIPTYIKKINIENVNALSLRGFTDAANFPWHSSAAYEDDSYPEVIINCIDFLENKLGSTSVKNIIKTATRNLKKIDLEIINTSVKKNIAWEVVQNFFTQDLPTLEHNLSNPKDYYNLIFCPPKKNYELFLVKYQDRYVGLFDLYRHHNGIYFSSYCALMLREEGVKNLNDLSVVFQIKRILESEGMFLNLGGSETLGLHKFKEKFRYLTLNKMYWMCFLK